MAIRMIEDAGWCDGVRLAQGAVVELSPTAEADFIALGLAESVADERQTVVEEAVVGPPENTARRTKRR